MYFGICYFLFWRKHVLRNKHVCCLISFSPDPSLIEFSTLSLRNSYLSCWSYQRKLAMKKISSFKNILFLIDLGKYYSFNDYYSIVKLVHVNAIMISSRHRNILRLESLERIVFVVLIVCLVQ